MYGPKYRQELPLFDDATNRFYVFGEVNSMFSDQLDTIDKLSRTPNMFKQKYNGRYFMWMLMVDLDNIGLLSLSTSYRN